MTRTRSRAEVIDIPSGGSVDNGRPALNFLPVPPSRPASRTGFVSSPCMRFHSISVELDAVFTQRVCTARAGWQRGLRELALSSP